MAKVTERKLKDGSLERVIEGTVTGKPDVKTVITVHGSFTRSAIRSEGKRYDFYSYLPETILGNFFMLRERYSVKEDGSLESMPYMQSLSIAENPTLFRKDARKYCVDNRIYRNRRGR